MTRRIILMTVALTFVLCSLVSIVARAEEKPSITISTTSGEKIRMAVAPSVPPASSPCVRSYSMGKNVLGMIDLNDNGNVVDPDCKFLEEDNPGYGPPEGENAELVTSIRDCLTQAHRSADILERCSVGWRACADRQSDMDELRTKLRETEDDLVFNKIVMVLLLVIIALFVTSTVYNRRKGESK